MSLHLLNSGMGLVRFRIGSGWKGRRRGSYCGGCFTVKIKDKLKVHINPPQFLVVCIEDAKRAGKLLYSF